jgi:hypothetical protein
MRRLWPTAFAPGGRGVGWEGGIFLEAGIVHSVQRLTMGWTVRDSIPSGNRIFHTSLDRLSRRLDGRPALVAFCARSTVPSSESKAAGRDVIHPPLPSVEVKERVQLYLSFRFTACCMSKFVYFFIQSTFLRKSR